MYSEKKSTIRTKSMKTESYFAEFTERKFYWMWISLENPVGMYDPVQVHTYNGKEISTVSVR